MKKKKLKIPYEATSKDCKCAKMIRRAAFIQLKKYLDFYLSEGSWDMIQLATEDFLELVNISQELERCGPRAVESLVYDLDTDVRDIIPQTAYDHIMGD